MDISTESQSDTGLALNPAFRDRAEALLIALLQATDDGILMSGLDRQDIIANRRLGELFEMPPQEVVENNPAAVRPRLHALLSDPEGFEVGLQRTYADPQATYTGEIELRTDPPRTLRRFTGPVPDSSGEPFGRIWTFLDITETKRLQTELQAQLEARTRDYTETAEVLRAMNEISHIAVLRLDTETLLVRLVDQVRYLLGYECAAILLSTRERNELEGVGAAVGGSARTWRLRDDDDTALADALLADPTQPPVTIGLYEDYRGALSARLRCSTFAVSPLVISEKVGGVLILGTRHASNVKEAGRTAHLEAIADQVAFAVQANRVQADLLDTTEALQLAQRKMVEGEKLRTAGTLAASVAHDIRNILATIQMELAFGQETPSEALRVQINRFDAMTHRLLAFARPGVLETHPTVLNEVIERILPLIEPQAQVNGVELVIRFPETLPAIAADSSQMENLFVNLCLNAIQAMSQAGGTLTLEGCVCENWVEIAVQDTGCGIAPELIRQIFEPFFTTRATGFGLGLFSCKRIVEEHGGQLTVQSEVGTGTRFAALFPITPFNETF